MFKLLEDSPVEMLRQFSVNLDADLRENFGASKMVLDNGNGKGSITLYELFPGLTAWVWNITFEQNYPFNMIFSNSRPYYFGYHISGYQKTKFAEEDGYQTIERGQNFILSSEPGVMAEFIIPGKVKYQCCYLIVQPKLLEESSTKVKRALIQNLSEIFSNTLNSSPYRYFGDIDLRSGRYVELIIDNERTDLVGRLMTEAAVLNMLASQIDAHDLEMKDDGFLAGLSKKEIQQISKLGDYVRARLSDKLTIATLSKEFQLSPKKLQAGIRFLFGCTVNEYLGKVRIGVARELIYSTNMTVSEICYKVGYGSRSYFSKIFKERFGILPSVYKKAILKKTPVFEITYRSIAKENIKSYDVENLVKEARINNAKHGITGSLIFHKKVFFQLIEGPKKNILQLYKNIKQDSRHFDVDSMWVGYKPAKDFANWDLALLSESGILEIPLDGDTKKLNLGNLLQDMDENSLASQNVWRKVRNVIKTA